MRANLATACLSIARSQLIPQQSKAAAGVGSILDAWAVRLEVLGLAGQLQPGLRQDQLSQALHDGCLSADAAMRREALITLGTMLQEQGMQALPWITPSAVWHILQQVLDWDVASQDPALAVAAMTVASAMAFLTYTGNLQHNSAQCNPASSQYKRLRLAAQGPGQPASRDAPEGHDHHHSQEAPESSQAITREHAVAVHNCLTAWCAHWHPRVRQAALVGLLAAHTGIPPRHVASATATSNQEDISSALAPLPGTASPGHRTSCTADVQPTLGSSAVQSGVIGSRSRGQQLSHITHHTHHHQPVYLCSSSQLVEAAYGTAVTSLADDWPAVRSAACRVVAGLAGAHAALYLPGVRWLHLGQRQALVDDAFQRLCGVIRDAEPHIRQLALQLLAGLHIHNLCVKLQVLSKKATISVNLPVPDVPLTAAGSSSASASQPTQQGKRKQGQQQQGRKQKGNGSGGDAGRSMSGRVGQLPEGLEACWCGPPGARGLSLLDVSIGALVHGIEDEEWTVRSATVSMLLALAAQEVKVVMGAEPVAAHLTGSGAGMSIGQAVAGRQQVISQCAEYLCDLLQDEVTLVRCEALSALAALVEMAAGGGGSVSTTAGTHTSTLAEGSNKSAAQAFGNAHHGGLESGIDTAVQATAQVPVNTAGGAPGGTAARQAATVVLSVDQVMVILGCLSDPHAGARALARQLLGTWPAWTTQLVKALALASAHALGLQPGQEAQQVLELIRQVATRVPHVAKNVATGIAKQQQAALPAAASNTSPASQSQAKPQALPATAKQQLLVMKALLQGSNGLRNLKATE